ncbi:hypothetical protein DFS33DRAFT_1125158 [Desarmillaria ectypa]|nr:hypothetical protein DFS33DRAFT_1125158 [Desarmillaria ectypa]
MIGVANRLHAYQNGFIYHPYILFLLPVLVLRYFWGAYVGVAVCVSRGSICMTLLVGQRGTDSPDLGTFFRAFLNCNLPRPADVEIMCLNREAVLRLDGIDCSEVKKGADTVWESHKNGVPEIMFIGTSSEVALCLKVGKLLEPGPVWVMLMPSHDHFIWDDLLGVGKALVMAGEAWGSYGWARWAHTSVSMHTIGLSVPQDAL